MKHTYLYPLPASARFLWMLARTDPADLFGDPDPHHQAGTFTYLRLSEEFHHARMVVMRLIENTPRVCLGRGFSIPGSQVTDAGYADPLHWTTERATELFWDAPKLGNDLYLRTVRLADKKHEVPGRDPAAMIGQFLAAHHKQHIIPVWM